MSRVRFFVLASLLFIPALAWGAATRPDALGDSSWVSTLPYVTRISTLPPRPNPHEQTRLLIEGRFPNDCGVLLGGGEGASVWIQPLANCDSIGPTPSWGRAFDLGQLASGTHRVLVTLRVSRDDTPNDPYVYSEYFEFVVGRDSIPIGPLPFVNQILVEPATRWPGVARPICPYDSILVTARGMFPNSCYRLLRVDVLPSPIATPLPEPPVVQFVIDDGGCLDRPCLEVLTPWEGSVVIPPLPARNYRLITQVGTVTCPDTIPEVGAVTTAAIPFRVDPCGIPQSCVIGSWVHGGPTCDAHVSPDGRAEVTFAVATQTALAGLQGSFAVDPGGMRIAKIEAIGPAAGMHVQWRAVGLGAKFTMFAERGAPIPGASGDSIGAAVPILRITLERVARRLPPVIHVSANGLLGSDADGNAVHECRIETLVVVAARICSERGCDFNADGANDVRDLVLMARCIFATTTDSAGHVYGQMCADSTSVPDCNGDGVRSIADAVCCGIRILRGPDCPECPPDTTAPRPAPGVRVVLGAPSYTETGVDVTVAIEGSDDLGGAVVRLDYPADRYEANMLATDSYGWLRLSDVAEGTATLALIRAIDPGQVYVREFAPVPMKLRLSLKPGKTHGGVVKLAGLEISDPDGAKLLPNAQSAVSALGGPAVLALSGARPNPAARVARFGLTLDRPSTVSVAIYDLGGRLVASLHRGQLGVGTHDFTWNGVSDDGSAAPGGVYFYRATADGATASRKLVLLGK